MRRFVSQSSLFGMIETWLFMRIDIAKGLQLLEKLQVM